MKSIQKAAGRKADGTFARGNPGGPGRPARHVELEYTSAMYAACSLEDWHEIVSKAVADAKAGDPKARAWLASYLLGAPKAEAKLFTAADKARCIEERFPTV